MSAPGAFRNIQDSNNHGGNAVSTPNGSVYVNGNRLMVVGAQLGPHGKHVSGVMVDGSETVTAENIKACREGDPTICTYYYYDTGGRHTGYSTHYAGASSPDVFIG